MKLQLQNNVKTMNSIAEVAYQISVALISLPVTSVRGPSMASLVSKTLQKLVNCNPPSPSLVAKVIDPHLLTHQYLALCMFNWAAEKPEFEHTPLTFQSILKCLSLSRNLNAIFPILEQVKSQNARIDSSVCECIIDAFIQTGRIHDALLIFNDDKLRSCNDRIRSDIFNSLLGGLGREGKVADAWKLFDEMTQKRIQFTSIGFGLFVWKICTNVDLTRLLSVLDDVKNSNTEINGSIIAALVVLGLCRANRAVDASWILDELRIINYKPDFISYRIVAEAFRSMRSIYDEDKVLKMKRKLGVAPRSSEYTDFIMQLLAERKTQEAKELGEAIMDGDFPIDDLVLNELIVSVSGIDARSAIEFLKFAVTKKKLLTLRAIRSLSRNLCKHNKIDELLELYHISSSSSLLSDRESYEVMFSYLCLAGRGKEAYRVLNEMKKKRFSPDISMLDSLMELCCKEDLLLSAKRLWDEMFVTGCKPGLRSYNILISKLSEVGETDEALRLFHGMLGRGVAPDAMTYTSLLDGLCEETKFEVAIEVFEKFALQDVLLAHALLTIFIINLCEKGQFLVAAKLLCRLPCDCEKESAGSHMVVMKHLVDAGELEAALEHVEHLRNSSPASPLSSYERIYTELLSSLSSSSNPGCFLQLLRSIREKEI